MHYLMYLPESAFPLYTSDCVAIAMLRLLSSILFTSNTEMESSSTLEGEGGGSLRSSVYMVYSRFSAVLAHL